MSLEDTLKRIMKVDVGIVGISTLTPIIKRSLRLAAGLRQASLDQKIILGGPHASIFPERTLRESPATDIIVRGEGELTMLNLIRALETGRDFSRVGGLVIRERDGKPVLTGPGSLVENLDFSSFPSSRPSPHGQV